MVLMYSLSEINNYIEKEDKQKEELSLCPKASG